jgi:pimeloyl-ACP methyl ester carboxylesterase
VRRGEVSAVASESKPTWGSASTAEVFNRLPTVVVDGATLAYREQGDGEPVVFIHGSASDLRTWDQQVPAIAKSHRAIAYSRRYARPNEDIRPGLDDQMLPHVDDLTALLRVMDAAPAHLVGHSWGAFICLLTSIRHPWLVRSMVLQEPPVLSLFTSTPPRPRELLPLLVRRPKTGLAILKFGGRTIAPVRRAFRRGDDDQALQKFAHGVLGKDTYERLPEERRQQARENLNTLRAQVMGAGFPPLSEDDVRGVVAPTLLMTGERSPAFLLRLTDRLQQLLPRAERVEIAGASHAMHEENSDAVNEAILGFLARHASQTSGGRGRMVQPRSPRGMNEPANPAP